MLCRCMLLLCLMRAVLFHCAAQHSRPKSVCSLCYTKQTDGESGFARGPLLYPTQTPESLVSGNNPVFIVGREQRKAAPDICFQAHVPIEKKLLPSAASLKCVSSSNHRGYKAILWGLLLETLCNMYSQYGSYKPLDLPTPVCVLTCGPRWEVLQRRSLHHSIRLTHHKHFIKYCVVVDEALDHARRLDVMQVFFAEDNGHLVGRRTQWNDTATRKH